MRTIEIIEGVTLTATEKALALYADVRACVENLSSPNSDEMDWWDWDSEMECLWANLQAWRAYHG